MEIVTISQSDLESLLRNVVRQELDARERPGDILTQKQLAERYGWSDSTIRRKIKQGMPCMGDRYKRFRVSEVEKWLTQQASYL